jgi:gas vesicle protein
MAEKKSGFGLGLLLGSIVGAVAAIFSTPKTGAEMRQLAKKWLEEEVENIKKASKKIDKKKFQQAVEKVINRIKKETKKGEKELAALKKHLLSRWERMKGKETKK